MDSTMAKFTAKMTDGTEREFTTVEAMVDAIRADAIAATTAKKAAPMAAAKAVAFRTQAKSAKSQYAGTVEAGISFAGNYPAVRLPRKQMEAMIAYIRSDEGVADWAAIRDQVADERVKVAGHVAATATA